LKIFFGSGQISEKEISSGNIPDFIVDNNSDLWGKDLLGVLIKSPESIKKTHISQVIICSSSITDIVEQLGELGVESSKINVSNFIGAVARTHALEAYRFEGYVSSGLPSTTKSLKGGGIYYVKEQNDSILVEKIFEANTHGMILEEDTLIFTAQGVGVVIYDIQRKEVLKTISLPEGYRPHGVRQRDGQLFVACSSADVILQIENDQVIRTYEISDKIKKIGTAQHHINDLYVDEHSIYVSMFSLSGNWKKGVFDGGVLEIDRDTGNQKIIMQDLKMPHSVGMIDDTLIVLDSYRGIVRGYDGVPIGALPGFVRGISTADNFIIVGESKNRNISKLEPKLTFSSIDTRITIIDSKISASRSVALPRGISEIHAIASIKNRSD